MLHKAQGRGNPRQNRAEQGWGGQPAGRMPALPAGEGAADDGVCWQGSCDEQHEPPVEIVHGQAMRRSTTRVQPAAGVAIAIARRRTASLHPSTPLPPRFNNELSSFSNYGVKTAHVAAPGEWIMSTVVGGGYDYLHGTSMATPIVSYPSSEPPHLLPRSSCPAPSPPK